MNTWPMLVWIFARRELEAGENVDSFIERRDRTLVDERVTGCFGARSCSAV